MKVKTARPFMYIGGPVKNYSDEKCMIDVPDTKDCQNYICIHPYCDPMIEVTDGSTDKGRIGSKAGRNRRAVDASDKSAEPVHGGEQDS